MSLILLVLGILITGAGIVTIGFGFFQDDPGFGNTLIVAGTTSLSAGVILIGLAAAVSQLVQIAQALRPRVAARAPARPAEPAAPAPPMPPVVVRPAPARPPVAARPRPEPQVEERIPEPPVAADQASEVSASAIERLRSSLARQEQKKSAEMTEAETAPVSQEASAQAASLPAGKGANGATPPPAPTSDEPSKPKLDFLFRSKARDAPLPEPFDSVWPRRPQPDQPTQPAELTKPPVRSPARPRPPETSPPPASEEAPAPAILKSGVVDGMPYTLYVDGSIEAQLPEGTVRFSSIAELRAHIEKNS
jgi:hypothetical protein